MYLSAAREGACMSNRLSDLGALAAPRHLHDGLGNIRTSADDSQVFFDRSLGAVATGTNGFGPNQISSATLAGSTTGNSGNPTTTARRASPSGVPVGLRYCRFEVY